jgi:ankyrin repeat protein
MSFGKQVLLTAVVEGKSAALEGLLELGADPNCTIEGEPLISYAAWLGQLECIKVLVQRVDVDTRSSDKSTPIRDAARNGRDDVVKFLADAGADVDAVDDFGESALFDVVRTGRLSTVEALISKGANVNLANKSGMTPLMFAMDNLEIAQMLVSKGANVNASDRLGVTALMDASVYGNAAAVKFLLSNNASINAQDRKGDTALMISMVFARCDVMEILLKAGADKDIKNNRGMTVEQWHTDCLERLNACSKVWNDMKCDAPEVRSAKRPRVARDV